MIIRVVLFLSVELLYFISTVLEGKYHDAKAKLAQQLIAKGERIRVLNEPYISIYNVELKVLAL